jgi:excisionase family DNA binding protein
MAQVIERSLRRMPTLLDLKAKLDADPDCAAVRSVPIPSGEALLVVYRDLDGYYTITDRDQAHKECWFEWANAVAALGEQWANTEDWSCQVRESCEDLLTLQYIARRLNVSEDTVRRWCKAGAVDSIPLPTAGEYQSYRIRRAVLHELLRRRIPVAMRAS